ncbi:MAG: methionine adenosyltransferase [Acidobacteriota bacterium]
MIEGLPRTAEHVAAGHPDKFCDQVADRILDAALDLSAPDGEDTVMAVRTAIECLAKDNLLIVSGEVKMTPEVRAALNVTELAREVWKEIGYGEDTETLTVIDHIRSQSPHIAEGTDSFGAGDQGIMVGYASAETEAFMPREYQLSRDIIVTLRELQTSKRLPWLRADCKSQVSLDGDGNISSVVIAAQHSEDIGLEDVFSSVYEHVVVPVCGEVDPSNVKINGTGIFVIGGPTGDAGVVGRKIVVDAYGPRVPVGGGAYSGKDATKVDRSAAYMCRHIAKTIVAHGIGDAKECTVKLAYCIGKTQPEMVLAFTDQQKDLSGWVREHFTDLSPRGIIDQLGLFRPEGWRFRDTAYHGHYGRDGFPWEAIAGV